MTTGWKRWKGELVNPARYARLVAAAAAAGFPVDEPTPEAPEQLTLGFEEGSVPTIETLTPGQKAAATRAAKKAAKEATKAEPLGGGIVTSSADLEAEALADAGGSDPSDPVDEAAEALSDALAELGGEG